ncbi:MAG: biopolymer transporter ExbD [Gemmataceae bacterium]|nr:biopolymer transporter ExbD [Gemmataceae bacterium]
MDGKRRFLDVWIIETNTVYQEVPFDVVADWLQQGRLLPNDRLKPSGTADWTDIGESPEFKPYVVKEEPGRPSDHAEALEPLLDQGFNPPVRRGFDDEDEDVDMIPLIDVSLVLLIFFMMAAAGAGVGVFVNAPATDHGLMADDPSAIRIDITADGPGGKPVYAVGKGNTPAPPDDRDLPGLPAALVRVEDELKRGPGQVKVVINADKTLPAKVARDALLALAREPFKGRISAQFFGVSEKE